MEVEKEKVNNLVNELRHQAVEKDSSHVHEMAVEKEKINKLEKSNSDLRTILQETSEFYPTLAEIIADFAVLEEERVAQHLETKPHPAIASAEKVRAAARARRQAEQRFRVLKYQLSYYESVFPWIVELTGRSTKELLEDLELQLKSEEPSENVADGDPIRRWLAESEFARLSSAERSDLALSRWRESRLSKWHIGREYERAVGYQYEQDGYSVEYVGAIKGYEDMGRDLVAKKDNKTHLVQCKYWSNEKTIHEKHVFQLIGTALEYACNAAAKKVSNLDLVNMGIVPILVTSTSLSEIARRCADLTGVEVREGYPLKPYPQIKCNISGRTREKIYHLPFDQQYDTTRIDRENGEFYAQTAAEAERHGFRRAQRYYSGTPG